MQKFINRFPPMVLFATIFVALASLAAVSLIVVDWGADEARSRSSACAAPQFSMHAELKNPETITLGLEQAYIALDTGKDFVINFPVGGVYHSRYGLSITGGRNVRVNGGTVDVADGLDRQGERRARGMFLKGQTGVIEVDSVELVSSTEGLTEGINLEEKDGATVILRNIRVGQVSGSKVSNHADVLQTWAGPKVLIVDGLSGSTDYQGLFLTPFQRWPGGNVGMYYLRNVDVAVPSAAGYLYWKDDALKLDICSVKVSQSAKSKLLKRSEYVWPEGDPIWDSVQYR